MMKSRVHAYVLGVSTILTGALVVHADPGISDFELRATFDQAAFYSPIVNFPQTIGL
jgi:hypothetical protein